MTEVRKGVLAALRRPKVARPLIRTGVTRAGTVGVEYVHQGVKGWGASQSAARAAWEANRSMAKRDMWAADLEVPVVPDYRGQRANYRSGTAKVGKRYTGAATGTGAPKKVQPTRVAGRKTPGAGITMRDESKPPIDPSLIGKASSYTDIPNAHRGRTISVTDPKGRNRRLRVRSHEHGAAMQGLERGVRGYQGAELGAALTQNRSAHTQRAASSVGAAVGASLPPTRRSTSHYRADGWWKPTGVAPGRTTDPHATELRLRRHSRKERRNERILNTGVGAVGGTALGSMIGQATHMHGSMSRRRLATSLGLGALGGAGAGFAISPRHHSLEYRRPKNKPVRKRERSYNPEHNRQRRLGMASAATGIGGAASLGAGGLAIRNASRHVDAGRSSLQIKAKQPGTKREAREVMEALADREKNGLMLVSRRTRGKLGLGAGLLGASAGLHHYAGSRANREWR